MSDTLCLSENLRTPSGLPCGNTCEELCNAIIEGDLHIVKDILKENPTVVNEKYMSNTPLHIAILECADDYIANLILDIPDIDLSIQDIDGDTALNVAVGQRKSNIVRRILYLNPNVITILDNYGDSPIHAAYDNTEMLQILIENGGRLAKKLLGMRGRVAKPNESFIHRYRFDEVCKNRQERGMTVMEMARISGNSSGVRYLQNFICY